jgi:RNA polymerase sigma factor (sigma-70 family)
VTEQELHHNIEGCRRSDRMSQQRIYKQFHNYALSVCYRYAASNEEAKEILNDAFFKIFTKLDRYDSQYSFKGWLHRVVVNTAIDRYRSRANEPKYGELILANHVEVVEEVVENLTREEVYKMVQALPPAYRTAFNLFVVDGFSHGEIAQMLQITEGASKSNLSKARQRLRQMLLSDEGEAVGWQQ